MHRVRVAEVFPPGGPPVVAERFELRSDTSAHSHDFIELALVTGGTATHVSATGERDLDRGSVTMLRPGDWHGYRDCRRLVVYNMYVGPEVLQRELAWTRADPHIGGVLHTVGPATARVIRYGSTPPHCAPSRPGWPRSRTGPTRSPVPDRPMPYGWEYCSASWAARRRLFPPTPPATEPASPIRPSWRRRDCWRATFGAPGTSRNSPPL